MTTGFCPKRKPGIQARAGKRPSIWLVACLLIFLVTLLAPSAVHASAGQWPALQDIKGKAWLVIDRETGKVIIEHEADQIIYPASTTKIMTAIIAIESGRLGDTVTVSETAVKLPSGASRAGFLAGEQVVLEDVLYGMMLASGNEAANILAEAIAGSMDAFADKMNAKAEDLGLANSHFVNACGLHDPAHTTTARDMAHLAAYAMQNPKFRELVATRSYSLPATNLHPFNGWSVFSNSNRLVQFGDLHFKSDLLAGYEGIKTGTTGDAGNCLVAAATSVNGQKLVSVLFGVSSDTAEGNMYTYTRTLLEEAARLSGATPATAAPSETTSETAPSQTTGETAQTTTAPVQTTASQSETTTAASSDNTVRPDGQQNETIFWRSASFVLLLVWLATTLLLVIIWSQKQKQRNAVQPRHIRNNQKQGRNN
jgi:D-alanyl-D-alanine carboxypeptidase